MALLGLCSPCEGSKFLPHLSLIWVLLPTEILGLKL